MGAFSKVAEVNHGDAEGLAELKRFAHFCQVGAWIQSLAKLLRRQIRRQARNVKEEEEERRKLEEERRELVEGLAAQLYLLTETSKEDEVFRKEVICKMVEIIKEAIEIASATPQWATFYRMRAGIEEQIYKAAFQISKTRWVRTEEGKVVPLEREYQTAADHEVVKLKEELEEADRRLKERCAELKEEKENKEKQYAEVVNQLTEELGEANRASADLLKENKSKEKRCAELEEENRHLKTSPEDGDLVAKLKEELEEANIASHKRYAELKEENARLKKENESQEKQCAKLEEENIASHKKHDDLSKRYAELEKENENKEKRCAELVEENKASHKKHDDLLKRCAELEVENGASHKKHDDLLKRCAELEVENRHLKRRDSPEDGDLAGPNSVSPSNSGLQVGPPDPAEGAAVRVETTPAPTGAECLETIKVLKKVMKLADTVISFAVSLLFGLLTLNQSVEPQAPAYKAFKFCTFVTFACGLSMSLLTICDFPASYKMPIIRGLVYVTRGFQVLSGVCVCIAFMEAIDLLAFVPVIVVVIVACIIVYYKDSGSSGQPRRTNGGLLSRNAVSLCLDGGVSNRHLGLVCFL